MLFQFNPKTKLLALNEDDSFERLESQLMRVGLNSKMDYFYISLNTQLIHSHYIDHYNTAKDYQDYSRQMKFLRNALSYRTERKRITKLNDAKNILNNQNSFKLGKRYGINLILPVRNEWKRLIDAWENSSELNDREFLRKFFRPRHHHPHKKIRQFYSLPNKSSGGPDLLKEKPSWKTTGQYFRSSMIPILELMVPKLSFQSATVKVRLVSYSPNQPNLETHFY